VRDRALALVERVDDPARRLNLLREYLQALVLRSLHENEAFTKIAFVGGTALRFLENLPRFSEGLDFSVIEHVGYEPERWLKKVRRDLELAGVTCRVTFNASRTVQVSWISVAALLQEAGLPVDARHDDRTPLLSAAMYGRVETALLLIDAGADVNARARGGGNPLMMATVMSCTENAEILKKAGAR
jgi:hypothetical protein